jgi:hypothetical protein
MKASLPLKIAVLLTYVALCTSLVLDSDLDESRSARARAFSLYYLH